MPTYSETGAREEIEFWRAVFEEHQAGGQRWINDFLDPARPLQPEIVARLPSSPAGDHYTILDVGCGPVSVIGYLTEPNRAAIVGVDPLADQYRELYRHYDLHNPIDLRRGFAERLTDSFRPASVDFVNCVNALDHCYDPRQALSSLVTVLREGCFAHLEVFVNEAEYASYTGFHQWNFSPLCDRVVIWNRTEIMFLDDLIPACPYRYEQQTKVIGEDEQAREILRIELFKPSPQQQQKIDTGANVQILYSPIAGTITLHATGDLQTSEFFLHVLDDSESGFRPHPCPWHEPYADLHLWLPPDAQGARIGQFEKTLKDGKIEFNNLWEYELPSAWFTKL